MSDHERLLGARPVWPTAIRSRLTDGRLVGERPGGGTTAWLYRAVNLGPVVDASTAAAALVPGQPLVNLVEELAAMTPISTSVRRMARTSYRELHVLSVNLPRLYRPAPKQLGRPYLVANYADTRVEQRVLLVGVRLRDRVGGAGGWRDAIDSVVETLVSGTIPMADFDPDHRAVGAAMARAGLRDPTPDELHAAEAWWNHGEFADTPQLVHGDHLHVFGSEAAVQDAVRTGQVASGECRDWPPIPGHHAISFATVTDYPTLDQRPQASSPRAHWAARLIDAGAACVSVRATIEPADVTRAELRRNSRRFVADVEELRAAGKLDRAEQAETLQSLRDAESDYASGSAPATLVDVSTVVGIDGIPGDLVELGRTCGVTMRPLLYRQRDAMAETWLASSVRANPHLHDLPAPVLAHSAIADLSTVGDREGALVGFTERDHQPAYLSSDAASRADSLPLCLVAGATGSGKTVLMLHLAHQYARMGTPVIVLDPKQGSAHDGTVESAGGQVASLDDLASGDGVFDPMRFARSTEMGIELAASMLMQVNPFGTRRHDWETPLIRALAYGADRGAVCTGQALQIADAAGHAPHEMVERVIHVAESSPMFRACVGMEPGTTPLSAAQGITLVKVGDAHLDLPSPGTRPVDQSQGQRISAALVRMMVFGSAMALTGRHGVLMIDEAWVVIQNGRSEVERLGRLARSQGVLPMLFTQRVTDATDAGLQGYISRGLILGISDKEEARAACELFELEPNDGRLARITARGTIGATGGVEAPNWESFRHLRAARTGRTLRGSIAIYVDLAGRAVPVEVILPEPFLRLASTNPDDIRTRRARQLRMANAAT